MNPFVQQILNPQLERLNEQYAIQARDLEGSAAKLNAFGGNRYALEQDLINRRKDVAINDLTASSMKTAYDEAMKLSQDNRMAALQAGNSYTTLGSGQLSKEQSDIKAAYDEFVRMQQGKMDWLSTQGSVLGGMRVGQTTEGTTANTGTNTSNANTFGVTDTTGSSNTTGTTSSQGTSANQGTTSGTTSENSTNKSTNQSTGTNRSTGATSSSGTNSSTSTNSSTGTSSSTGTNSSTGTTSSTGTSDMTGTNQSTGTQSNTGTTSSSGTTSMSGSQSGSTSSNQTQTGPDPNLLGAIAGVLITGVGMANQK